MGIILGPDIRPPDRDVKSAWSKTCQDWQYLAALLRKVHLGGGWIGGQKSLRDGAALWGSESMDRGGDPHDEADVAASLAGLGLRFSPH